MEASWAPSGKVRLELPLSNFLLLNWALWTTGAALEWDEKWFRELTGLSPAQVRALNDELTIMRFALEGSPRFISAVTGEPRPPLEPSKSGTAAWDDLPDIEAENLPGRMVVVTLPLVHLQDRFRLTGYDTVHENTDLCTSVVRKGAREPRKGAALQRRLRHAPLAGALGEREGRARPEDRLEPRMR